MDDIKPNSINRQMPCLPIQLQDMYSAVFQESWKSDLKFTGDNPEFPIEIFMEVMEKKYGLFQSMKARKYQHHKSCLRVLKHISEDENTPASIWKKAFVNSVNKKDLQWPKMKKELIKHFRRTRNREEYHCTSLEEQILLFNSLLKGENEPFSLFCTRVSAITSILEHGYICKTRKPSEHWVKLFFLMGLSEDDRNLIIQDADSILKIKDLCSVISERKKDKEQGKNSLVQKQSEFSDCSNPSEPDEIASNNLKNADYTLEISEACNSNDVTQSIDGLDNKIDNKVFVESDREQLKEEIPCELPLMLENNDRNNTSEFDPNMQLPMIENTNEGIDPNVEPNSTSNIKSEVTELFCLICNKTFTTRKCLKIHNREIHPTDITTKCPHCNFERYDKRSVIIHIQRTHSEHRNEKPFQCHQCSKSYRFNFKLTAHCRLAHGDGGIYKCNQCPYKCDQKNRLQEHVDGIHGKKKNFKCDKCDFSTSWRRGLTTHLWVLHGEGKGRIYTCEQCGYTTKVQSLYRNHLMNLHNIGEYKPGLCPICGMTFKTKAYLMDHMYKVHKKTLKGKDTKAAAKDATEDAGITKERKETPKEAVQNIHPWISKEYPDIQEN